MFRITLLVIVLGLQLMLYLLSRRWLRRQFPTRPRLQVVLASLFILFNATMAWVLLARPKVTVFPHWFIALAVNPFYIWHGATLILGVVVLAGLLVALPFKGFRMLLRITPRIGPSFRSFETRPAVRSFDAGRRTFIRRGLTGLSAVSFGGAAYGVLAGKSDLEYTNTGFVIPGLPEEFNGLRIGMVSDVHSSAFMTREDMDGYVQGLLSLHADLIVVPGDFVNSMTEEVYPFAASFSALHAPLGVYGVMGNHDYFAQDPERVAREVDACGVKILRNDNVVLRKGASSLTLMGLDDVGRPDRAAAMMQTAAGTINTPGPRILLCHRPYFLKQAADQGIDLVLSGHTHGGQVVFGRFGELIITPARLASPYVWGPYRLGAAQMFVSRGIGTVGLPMRINCPPEIALITLTRT
jgi:predicted MPP superfamily phosphohydrolase